jgi:hypothetical protein
MVGVELSTTLDEGSSSSFGTTSSVGSDDEVRDAKPDFDPVTLIVIV